MGGGHSPATLKQSWDLRRRLLVVSAQELMSGRGKMQVEFGHGVLTGQSGTSYLCLFPVLFDELITSRFRAVADEQFAVSDHGMVPGLAREDLEARHFLVAVRPRFLQGHIPLLRKDQQQVLIGQEQHLAVAVAAGFPFRPGRFVQAYADEKAGVEAVEVLARVPSRRLAGRVRRPNGQGIASKVNFYSQTCRA